MGREIKQALLFTLVTMALLGGAYPLALWVIGRVAYPGHAEGSLIRRADGTIAGSSLIAQRFDRPEYFQARPSAVDYDAAAAGGSNLGPSHPGHLAAVQGRLLAVTAREGVPPGRVPAELVTTSGSGLDPHLPPAAVELQAARVAAARGAPLALVLALIAARTEPPSLGFLGRARVNVLELNLALDDAFGAPAAGPAGEGR